MITKGSGCFMVAKWISFALQPIKGMQIQVVANEWHGR